jgi:hypothetical protein
MSFLGSTEVMRLTSLGYKVKDLEVKTQFALLFESVNEPSETFLAKLASDHYPAIQDCFIAPAWTSVKFEPVLSKIDVDFGGIKMIANLKTISVTRKTSAKTGTTYKYKLLFAKESIAKEDALLAEFLNYKTEDEDGKSHYETYDTTMKIV